MKNIMSVCATQNGHNQTSNLQKQSFLPWRWRSEL